MGFAIGFLKQMREAGFKPKEVILGHVTKHVIDALGPDAENITGLAYYFEGSTQDHKDYNEICRRAGFTWGEFMESSIRYWAYGLWDARHVALPGQRGRIRIHISCRKGLETASIQESIGRAKKLV
jgi:hypothetical protein